jgi:hypothetical protein
MVEVRQETTQTTSSTCATVETSAFSLIELKAAELINKIQESKSHKNLLIDHIGIDQSAQVLGKNVIINGDCEVSQTIAKPEASPLDRINVRRLLVQLREHVENCVSCFMFEPNDEVVRLLLEKQVNTYLDSLMNTGIKGYEVICDETNNTTSDMAEGYLHVDIMVNPIGGEDAHVYFRGTGHIQPADLVYEISLTVNPLNIQGDSDELGYKYHANCRKQ